MPWSLKGHSIIANAWRKNWALQVSLHLWACKIWRSVMSYTNHFSHQFLWRTSSLICDSSMVWKKWRFKNSNYIWWFFILTFTPWWLAKSPNKIDPRHSHWRLFVFDQNRWLDFHEFFASWNISFDSFSCKLQGLPTLRTTKNPSNSNSPKWMLLSTWKIFLPLPMHPGSYASSPNENRQGLHALHMALLLQNTNTIRSFAFTSFKKLVNFWRFGFFAETIATGQFFANLATNFCVCVCLNSSSFFSTTEKGGIYECSMQIGHSKWWSSMKLGRQNQLAINLEIAKIVRGMSLSKLPFGGVHFISAMGPSCRRRY